MMNMDAIVYSDHCYSRHWSESYKTDRSHVHPTQWLLPQCQRLSKTFGLLRQRTVKSSSSEGSDDEIDVESLNEVMSPSIIGKSWSFDLQRARVNMNETERYSFRNLVSSKHGGVNQRTDASWEENLNKSSWTMLQTKLFTKVMKILEDEKLARLAFKGVNNEPISRRLSLNRSAAYFRRVMAEFEWDQKLAQWLHSLMINQLPPSMLASYLDLVQTLRSKVPTLVERMIMPSTRETSSGSADSLNLLLKRPWEPVMITSLQSMRQKYSPPPFLVMLPSSPYPSSPTMTLRKRFWIHHLNLIGKVVQITPPDPACGSTVLSYVEALATAVKQRIKALRAKHPTRPIVLIGWHTSSILSCHISLVEKVSAIVCLGFPLFTMNGPRGTIDDVLCDLSTPTLFVVGEEADSCDIDDLEDFRERLLTMCDNYMLAIPGADDALKVSDKVKKGSSVTQTVIDKMMIDYIDKFLSDVFRRSGETNFRAQTPIFKQDDFFRSSQYVSEVAQTGSRKRELASNNISSMKRRRLSSSTTAKISEVLSGPKYGSHREGTKSPVQGLTYNLQTGSISGLTTVPTVIGRTSLKDSSQNSKHGKANSNKSQSRSIIIDLTKDTSAQLNSLSSKYRQAPDQTLVPTESQTEAAVATILGNISSDKSSPPTSGIDTLTTIGPSRDVSYPVVPAASAFTRLTPSKNTNKLSSESSSIRITSTATTISPISRTMTFGNNVDQISRQKQAYNNVKFKSTLVTKPSPPVRMLHENTSWLQMETNKPKSSIKNTPVRGKYAQYLTQHKVPEITAPFVSTSAFAHSLISSRSRKDERETMQATAILEQLTSSLGSEDKTFSVASTSAIQSPSADALSYRRHSYDSQRVPFDTRGRGRVQARGAWHPGPVGVTTAKRRKTVNLESPGGRYVGSRVNKDVVPSNVRYVMTSDMSSVLSSAAARAAAASSRSVTSHKNSNLTVVHEKTPQVKGQVRGQMMTYPSKPSLLPVYTLTAASSKSPSGGSKNIKIEMPSNSSTASPVNINKLPILNIGSHSQAKSQKVYLTQKLPVKFTGANMSVPTGANYTFVAIPANRPSATSIVRTTTSQCSSPAVKQVIQYSMVSTTPKSRVTPVTKVTHDSEGRMTLSLRDKAMKRANDGTTKQ